MDIPGCAMAMPPRLPWYGRARGGVRGRGRYRVVWIVAPARELRTVQGSAGVVSAPVFLCFFLWLPVDPPAHGPGAWVPSGRYLGDDGWHFASGVVCQSVRVGAWPLFLVRCGVGVNCGHHAGAPIAVSPA